MKRALALVLTLLVLAPHAVSAEPDDAAAAERAWKPFFAAFRDAARRRDRAALKKMMAEEFFTSGGLGSDRDEAFAFWDDPLTRGWEALERTLAKGAVPNTTLTDGRNRRPSRVAPPLANSRRAVRRAAFDWYAVFEFREDGRWYCTVFAQCCD
jgi:hypothetical protein